MEIIIGENNFNRLKKYLQDNNMDKLYIITDNIVHDLYIDYLKKSLIDFDLIIYILTSGEESKNMKNVFSIYDNLLQKNIDRDTVILSFGGGVVGDIAGFVAATYKRGLKYIQIPTTLLAQVDSSVGGKVGVDYGGYKNIIGSFYFPEIVITNTLFLNSLSTREIICGLGEILKYGLIYDYSLFEFTRDNIKNIYGKDLRILEFIVKKSICIKDEIVSKDKYDRGLRQTLNFGHTIGHSIESYYKFNKFNHGEAVILGMIYESYIAKEIALIDEKYFEEIYIVLKELVNPIEFTEKDIDSLIHIMKNDKKNINNKIAFILPNGRGKVDLYDKINKEIIKKSLSYKWI